MKKDRNCGMNNYADYQMMPFMPGMPNIAMSPGMNPNMVVNPNMGAMGAYPNTVTNINTNTNDEEINRLEQRINMLERRVAALEGNNNYGNYSSNSYQML